MSKILDDIFNAPEEQVETFMEAIKPSVVSPEFSRMAQDRPDQISIPELAEQVSGLIRIQYGYHGEDFVWHICAPHPPRPFKVSDDRVIYAIAKTMNAVIPNTVEVKIWLPMSDWEVREFTFKAMNLKACWNISGKELEQLNIKLFEVLNTLV
jgi:hypothetical protein